MTTYLRHTFGLGFLLLAAMGGEAQAATLPATTCTSTAPLTRTCDLWARPGTLALPGGASVAIWGYADSATGSPTVPGPVLIVNQGETVTVNLTNNLAETTALLFQGQSVAPDLAGVAPGATKTYTFVANAPGTYLYEAGLLPNAQHQAAIGLHGALIVRPATAGQAYDGAATAYLDEALLVLGEIDPALNANPVGFDLRDFSPRYFLVNGKAYPATDPIATTAGSTVLLRYVNAGIQHHSMTLLGSSQLVVAKDGSPLNYPGQRAAETIAPGQTMDAIATVPPTTVAGSKFAIFDGSLNLFNNRSAGFGGMLTFLTVGTAGAPGPDVVGPVATAVTITPATTAGTVSVALTATISDVATGGSNVTAAEYRIDSGASTPMAGAFGSPTASANATIPVATLAGLTSGTHTVYVRGQDSLGNWGAFNFATLTLDKTGPTTRGLVLTPATTGSSSVAIAATGDDSASGTSSVTAAQFTVDGACPAALAPCSASVNGPAPVAGLSASLPASYVTGLSAGSHAVAVRSQDALANWGAWASVPLTIDRTGPVASAVSAAPNPNNGTVPLDATNAVVRVTATFTDPATVAAAEGFIDAVGANGSGFPFIPRDGSFNGSPETGYADIPLTTVNALASGNHTISVHGKDAAGNWGAIASTTLVIDKVAPTINGLTIAPSTIAFGTASTSLTVSAADVGVGVTGGQYWIDGTATPPANAIAFAGTSATIAAAALPGGVHTVYVRVRDGATNWSSVSSATLTVIRAVADTRTITANNSATQTSDANAANGVLTNDQPTGLAGRSAAISTAPARTSGAGAGTISVSCPATLGTAATPAVGGSTVCTNGAYRVTLNGVGGNGTARRSSKQGTYQFSYTETLNGVSATATVTITVN